MSLQKMIGKISREIREISDKQSLGSRVENKTEARYETLVDKYSQGKKACFSISIANENATNSHKTWGITTMAIFLV